MQKYGYFYVLFFSVVSVLQSATRDKFTRTSSNCEPKESIMITNQAIESQLLSKYEEVNEKLKSFIEDSKCFLKDIINVENEYRIAIDEASGSYMQANPENYKSFSDALIEINKDFRCITGKNIDYRFNFIFFLIEKDFPEEQAQEMYDKYQKARRFLQENMPNKDTKEKKELYRRAKEERKNPRKELNDNLLNQIIDYIINDKSIDMVSSDFHENFEYYEDVFLICAFIKYYFYEKLSKPENIREYFLLKNKSKYDKILKEFTDIIEHKPLEDFDMDFSVFEYMIHNIFPVQIDTRTPIQIGNIIEGFDSDDMINMIFENLKNLIFENCCMGFFEYHVPDGSRWFGLAWKDFQLAEEDFAPIKEAENFDQIHTALIEIKKTKKCVWNVEFENRLNLLIILYKIIVQKYGKKLGILGSKSSLSSSSG